VACGLAEAIGKETCGRMPIYVRIVQFSQAHADNPTLALDTYIREACEPKWAALIQHALDSGRALVLLDGLDEVIDAHQRQGVAEAIHKLVADYPGNAFLIASRIVGYQAARLSGDFAHYTIQPLPPERITEFVEKWYTAIKREAGESGITEEARQRAEELGHTIRERSGIRRLAENPLLLTIIALINWRGRKLPNRRVELYAHAAETLIESWPYRRAGVRLETERVIRLLSPLAYRIFAARSAGDITEDELLPVLAEAICRVDGVNRREADRYAREFLSQVSEHSGIFRERGYDERGRRVFGFLHLTFAEYFTARYLAGLWEGLGNDAEARWAFLRKYAHVPRWREVVLLMAGDVGQRDNDRAERATRLLGDILQLDSDYEEQLHRDLLLAGECLADGLRMKSRAAEYVLNKLLGLVHQPGIGPAIQIIFRSIHRTDYDEFVQKSLQAPLETEDKWMKYRVARTLGEFDNPQAVKMLLEMLEVADWETRDRAAWALGELGDVQAIEPLIRRVEDENENWHVLANAAWALGELGDVQAVNPLRKLLENDHRWVCIRVEEALAKLGFQQETESLSDTSMAELLTIKIENLDEQSRWKIAVKLGHIGDKQAADWLLSRLQQDKSEFVRWAAAWALGELGEVRAVDSLLKCLEDKSMWVRWNAARTLGILGDRRAIQSLIERLHDEDPWVRKKVVEALGKLGDSLIIDKLMIALYDKHVNVEGSAYRSLIAILNRNASEPKPEDTPCEPQNDPDPWDR